MKKPYFVYPGLLSIEEMIIQVVCSDFQVNPHMVKSKDKTKPLPQVRQAICYFMKSFTEYSLEEIGRPFGYTHAGVIHCITTTNNDIETNPKHRDKINCLNKKISKYVSTMYGTQAS